MDHYQFKYIAKWVDAYRVDQFWNNIGCFSTIEMWFELSHRFVHYEIINGTHCEIIDFHMYIMQLIGIKIYKIIEVMDFWSSNSGYVTLEIIKWMNFGLIFMMELKSF